jgi:hypothetical protein
MRMWLWLCLLLLPNVALAELRAERITEKSFARRGVSGPDAIAGVGDWVVSNGTLCAAVSDPGHEGYLVPGGGSLVDLGFCGREDDQLANFEALANLSRKAGAVWTGIRADVSDEEAALVATGEWGGVAFEARYALDTRDPKRLRVTTRLERREDGGRLFALGDILVHNDGTLRPFTLARSGFSEGFHHHATGDASAVELAEAIVPVETVVLVGPSDSGPPISYGLRVARAQLERANGEQRNLPVFSLSTGTITVLAAFVRPFWIGGGDSLGFLELAQSLLMDVSAGDTLVMEREIRVEPVSDARVFTDEIFTNGTPVRGRVDTPGARIHVRTREGSAVTLIDVPDGEFEALLPPGLYTLDVRGPGGSRASLPLDLGVVPQTLPEIALPPTATVTLPRNFGPARVVFRGVGGTEDPRFRDDRLDYRVAGEPVPAMTQSTDLHVGGIRGDPKQAVLPPGRYRVYATRGPEFTLTHTEFEVAAGETHKLELATPTRAFASNGWLAADLHVHAAPSDDSTVPLRDRVASFLAEGGEILVATDHDHVTDYAPLLRKLGLRRRMRSVVGLEVTSTTHTDVAPSSAGHNNVFPLPYRPKQHRKGALRGESQRLRNIVHNARTLPGERIVQLNHAREIEVSAAADDGAYFSHLSQGTPYDPSLPLTAATHRALVDADPVTGLRDLDFDAMELINGPRISRYRALRRDWISLLRQGERKTGTGNSDTHTLQRVAALPRTYVAARNDRPSRFDEAEFIRNLRGGRAYVTTGPLVTARLGGAVLGDTFRGNQGTLEVDVKAAPWIPLSELRVALNGEDVAVLPLEGSTQVSVPLTFDADAFVTVEVEGPAEGDYAAVLPGFHPIAFTNPIYVDANSDGEWTPPGHRGADSP